MKINEIISAYIKQNKNLQAILEAGSETDSIDASIQIIGQAIIDSKFNVALASKYLLLLQRANENELIEQYELKDIRLLFYSSLKIQKDNLDLYLEAGHFEWEVMDDKEQALKIVKEGLKTANKKVQELSNLESEILND